VPYLLFQRSCEAKIVASKILGFENEKSCNQSMLPLRWRYHIPNFPSVPKKDAFAKQDDCQSLMAWKLVLFMLWASGIPNFWCERQRLVGAEEDSTRQPLS